MRIHPAPDLKCVHFPTYQRAIVQMHAEGLYSPDTGWLPASVARLVELMTEQTPHASKPTQQSPVDLSRRVKTPGRIKHPNRL